MGRWSMYSDERLRGMTDVPGTPGRTCGRSATYNWGCRCDLCRRAERDRKRSYRKRLRERVVA